LILTPDPFLERFNLVRALRRRPVLGYLAAVAGVLAATLLRLAFGSVLQVTPFTTFYPAIVFATLVGDVPAGALAVVLSALAANFAMTPTFSFASQGTALTATALFIAAAAMLVALTALLNRAVDRISQQAEEIKLILEAQPVGVMLVDGDGIIEFVNSRVEEEVGYSRQELRGRPVEMLVPDALRAFHKEARRGYTAHPERRPMGVGRSLFARRKDGSLIPVEVGLAPFRHPGFSGVLATVTDITQRKELERREVIAGEVRHRARNLLTIVHALARRTLPREDRAAFLDLLATMARTQDVLGAEATAPLRAIIKGELAGFAHQVADAGCDLRLSPRAAQDFALIVHELTTNALKYGALSRPEGRVEITCRREEDGRNFAFIWHERGGPEVSPPERRGFGSTILKDLALGFAASMDADYAPEGFRYELRAELARIGEVADAVEITTPT